MIHIDRSKTTEVMVFFDAGDCTSGRPSDALRDLCNLFHGEGFVVHVALAGCLAQEIERHGLKDVVEAMRPHLIGTRSMCNGEHPNIMEMSDGADYAAAYERVYRQEKEAVEIIHRVTGQRPFFAVPPGTSKSYVAMDVYADLGIKFYCDTVCSRDEAGGDWFQNMRQFPCSKTFRLEALVPGREGGIAGVSDDELGIDWTRALDKLASRPRQLIFMSPCMTDDAEVAVLYRARICELLRRIRSDGRFTLATLAGKAATEQGREPLVRKDFSDICLLHDDWPECRNHRSVFVAYTSEHAGGDVRRWYYSFSLAEMFQAVVAFLLDDSLREFRPGRAYGFLEKPYAIDHPVTLKTADMLEAAKSIDVSRHLPASIDVGGTRIGPGDFLAAALKALGWQIYWKLVADGSRRALDGPFSELPESVTISPTDPLADLDQFPELRDFRPAVTQVSWPGYKDEFTSDRLRWQLWTWRRECPRPER